MNFEEWLKHTGKKDKTANNYARAITGSISEWASKAQLITNNLSEAASLTEFQSLADKIKQLDIFQERNSVGNGMYSAALNHFSAYLSDLSGEDILEDIESVIGDASLERTEKSTLINARVGQGKFRTQLIDYWKGCALTGFSDTRLLVASHIKPWKKSDNRERLDSFNGLLLIPNLDKVFDLGFITFEETGSIKISGMLENTEQLGIPKDMRVKLTDAHQEYMNFHREYVFEKHCLS